MILLECVDNESPTFYSLYCSSIRTINILTYIRAICCPIQFLGPLTKGIKEDEFYNG